MTVPCYMSFMHSFIFRNVLSIDEYTSFFDNIDPLAPYKKWTTINGANHEKTISNLAEKKKVCSERVDAAFIVSDSVDWSRDIQVAFSFTSSMTCSCNK